MEEDDSSDTTQTQTENDDTAAEDLERLERSAVLGFVPQKELVYNSLLPYAKDVDIESNLNFAEIKANLGRAAQLRDLKVGVRHWMVQLERFITLYGYKFSKTDHILLVKLMLEILTMSTQEYALVEKAATMLTLLLRKRSLLSREDLTISWQPLYKIVKACSNEKRGFPVFPAKFQQNLKNTVVSCTPYFHEDATQEMLDEWRPWLCPFDMYVIGGLQCLDYFLPTSLPPELHHKGFKLWLDELLQLWLSFQNMPSWEANLVSLFSKVAHDNIGYIDWTPYVPMIFNRLLRSFCLPVGTRQLVPSRNHTTYEIAQVSTWIVSMMGGSNHSVVQEHVTKLFKALHSFYHPSNVGRWTMRLGSFLQNLPKMFVKRLRRERYKDMKWLTPVPEAYKLTEAQVTGFVESLKSAVFVAMFSKFGSHDASMALRSLATLRPEIVIPPLLEKMYPAMETLIEPHRLIACMICIVSVVRPMLTSTKYYPEGQSHVLPLLNLSLPGIDPNDFKKTLVTLQMISNFVALIPIVDSSDAVHQCPDLTEHQREICSATAQFEDFVLAFLDRVFNVIENSSQVATFGSMEKLTPEQTVMEIGLASTVSAMLQQCSSPIYTSALRKINNFITSNVFEVKVSGKLAANLCRAAVRVNPVLGLKTFVPHLCSSILGFIHDHPGAKDEEILDNTFLWNFLILSHVVRCEGSSLLPYQSELVEVLRHTLKFKSIQGYEIAGQLLKYVLRSLTQIYPLEFRSVDKDFDRPLNEYLPLNDWAVPGDLKTLNAGWHLATDEELDFAEVLVNEFFVPQLHFFQSISSENEIPREDLLRRLNIVLEVLIGAGSHFPAWESQKVNLIQNQVPLSRFSCLAKPDKRVLTAGGKNVRALVHDTMRHLLKYINVSREDDTKSLFHIIKIYEIIMQHYGTLKSEFESRWKSFHIVKVALENQLLTKKRHLRALLIDRIQLQHELRTLNCCDKELTARHLDILNDLLDLSVNRYREVRKKAQACLHQAFRSFTHSYITSVPALAKNLMNKEIESHIFKGSLYTIQGGGNKACMASKRDWSTLAILWPALVQADQFEKPSILKVIEDILNKVFKSMETFAITITTSDDVINSATKLLTEGSVPLPVLKSATPEELQSGVEFEKYYNELAQQNFSKLAEDLLDLIENGKLTWKFTQIGFEFLSLLLHEDMLPSTRIVSLYAKNCVNDLLNIRKLSCGALITIMELQKKKTKKIFVDIEKAAGVGPIVNSKLLPGDRPDNAWLQFDPKKFITNEEDWNKTVFIEKTHWGYYTWPKELKTYAPYHEQPKYCRERHEIPAAEQPIYDCFMNEEYVEKLFNFLALEEEKSTDHFRTSVLRFFKMLFHNFEDTFLPKFQVHIERLIKDTSHDKHASSQRCAMEVLAGIITGSKLWPYPKVEKLWLWITPLLEHTLNNITVETISDWGNFFLNICENRAPQRLQWLYRLLIKNPLSGEGGAFGDASRLYMLQQAILQQEWRIPAYLHDIVNYLRPHLAHTYKNVRDRIATLLSSCLHNDYQADSNSKTLSPRRADFILSVLPELEQFKDYVASYNGESDADRIGSEEPEEKVIAIRLCKTVVQWVSATFMRSLSPCLDEVFQLLPIIENLQSEANDEDLREDCKQVMLNLSMILVPEKSVDIALATIKEVAGLKSWHARANILNYMQPMVFGNFFLLQGDHYKKTIQAMLLHLLCDEQLEVREMAAVTLSGFIHCNYLELNKDMLEHFERLRSTKVKKSRTKEQVSLQGLIKRHAGVLGLSACVQAYPYDVPDFIPQVLVDLSVHVNDPQPIGMTVTKTLSNFRRTHHDNWHDHKRMFTDDQLVTLTDLLISPNYYA
ncbi:proteasome activator complex subunit 4-like [Biomphalaria glabrata]|uniref:Proteasome activator complex subunit 4-like n=1 Tax=Biomphalaria glabrata TaxID=6526 RepID=A0A9U8EGD6_BIOGL|nr:proteasome activator complex subunit 4-like [Biomphalaria glabrata]